MGFNKGYKMKLLIAWTVAIFLALGVSIAGAQTPLVPVTLDGGKTDDPDLGDVITYEWYDYERVHDFENEDPLAIGKNPTINFAKGKYKLTLRACDRRVGDPRILCTTSDVTIRVNLPNLPRGGNRPPVANAGPDQSVHSISKAP